MKRSKFSLSNYRLMTGDMGKLMPINCIDVLPGDSIQQSTSALIRMQALLAPLMHPINIRIHHWYVPYRLIWDDFEDFITGGHDGNAAPPYPTITITPDQAKKGTLVDYFGLPVETHPPGGNVTPNPCNMEVSALPFKAFWEIYNNFYRDQDLVDEVDFDRNHNLNVPNISWEKDTFTTARPWTEKGTEVSIPVDIIGTGGSWACTSNGQFIPVYVNPSSHDAFALYAPNAGGFESITLGKAGQKAGGLTGERININELRLALGLQRYQEARAMYGSRYIEYLRYLGVVSSDRRLGLPEYLGGGKQLMQVSEILQTAPGADGSFVGAQKGHGMGAMRSNRYRRFFEEHGCIISMISILPKAIYTQGIEKMWLKRTKEEYFQKELAHIGWQEVMERELYLAANNESTIFGYHPNYEEYRFAQNKVTGDFRDSMDFWHLARIFANSPKLNSDFIQCNPSKRIQASTTEPSLNIMLNHSVQARRIVPKDGVPI